VNLAKRLFLHCIFLSIKDKKDLHSEKTVKGFNVFLIIFYYSQVQRTYAWNAGGNMAKENIKKYQLTKKIEVKLGNGIETINENVDTIIISGMGGLNIIGILKYKTDLMKNVETLILSPNNDADKLRKEISKYDRTANKRTV